MWVCWVVVDMGLVVAGDGGVVAVGLRLLGCFKKIYIYIYIYIFIYIEQDLGTILRYCSLGSPFKILSSGFFLIRWKCIF